MISSRSTWEKLKEKKSWSEDFENFLGKHPLSSAVFCEGDKKIIPAILQKCPEQVLLWSSVNNCIYLTLLCLMSQHGQTHLKSLTANAENFQNLFGHFGTLCISHLMLLDSIENGISWWITRNRIISCAISPSHPVNFRKLN